jgi:hypothetical protein
LIADILAESMPAAKYYDALNEVPCGGSIEVAVLSIAGDFRLQAALEKRTISPTGYQAGEACKNKF